MLKKGLIAVIVVTGGLPFSKNKAEALNIDGTPLCHEVNYRGDVRAQLIRL